MWVTRHAGLRANAADAERYSAPISISKTGGAQAQVWTLQEVAQPAQAAFEGLALYWPSRRWLAIFLQREWRFAWGKYLLFFTFLQDRLYEKILSLSQGHVGPLPHFYSEKNAKS
jgi:hypothetical protein